MCGHSTGGRIFRRPFQPNCKPVYRGQDQHPHMEAKAPDAPPAEPPLPQSSRCPSDLAAIPLRCTAAAQQRVTWWGPTQLAVISMRGIVKAVASQLAAGCSCSSSLTSCSSASATAIAPAYHALQLTATYYTPKPAHPLTPAYYDPSAFKTRKPSIKRPSLHQWHFCDASYDAMKPMRGSEWKNLVKGTAQAAQQAAAEAEAAALAAAEAEAAGTSPEGQQQQQQLPQVAAADQQQQEAWPAPPLLNSAAVQAAVLAALPQMARNPEGAPLVPGQMLPPFAPLDAHYKDYHRLQYREQLPQFHRKRHRYNMRKLQSLAQQRWRLAAEGRAARAVRQDAKVQRAAQRQIRQAAWTAWCQQHWGQQQQTQQRQHS